LQVKKNRINRYINRDEKEGNLKRHASEMYIKNTDRQTDRPTLRQAGRHTYTNINKQKNKQTHRKEDRQTGRRN